MRGRLIQRFQAAIRRIDTAGMAATDPDGTGPATGGYDPILREPIHVDTDADGIGEPARLEQDEVRVPCQVDPEGDEALRSLGEGLAPRQSIDLVFHFRDLERLGLVSPAGKAMIAAGDRLAAIYDLSGNLVEQFPDPPGLFVTRTKTSGYGLSRRAPTRNLLLVRFEDRAQGASVRE